jgi:CBS domain-containing protein/gamma-glutamylcysteine synthetase
MDILKEFHPEWLTTELAQFNLETNLTPQEFTGNAFGLIEEELRDQLRQIQAVADRFDTRIILTGILPSLRKFDLNLDKLTPKERYLALMVALRNLRGSDYELHLDGIDELNLRHDSPLLEACNTSFQVHLQVAPKDFVPMYNLALAAAGPTLAMCANSPVLFGKRLWHETRIALFQQSIDNRKSNDHLRDRAPRVNFGNDWLEQSILEIYKEDIMRFRILLGADVEEDSLDCIKQGKIPKLKALQVHNGTVYRWNRPCYGISANGKPHLRIENRILSAGPTVLDEIANMAFWTGLMEGMSAHFGDIRRHMSFDDARDNFMKAARTGIDSKFTWVHNQKIAARELTQQELIPLARLGLQKRGINSQHIDQYLGIIEERAKQHMNGARWILRTFSKFKKEASVDESQTILTAAIYHNQSTSMPAHAWEIPELHEFDSYDPSKLLAEEFMSTDIFSVRKEDILEFAMSLLDWSDLEYMPVEDEEGHLLGIITTQHILQYYAQRGELEGEDYIATVGDVMDQQPRTVGPQATILEVIQVMRDGNLKILPVVKGKELIGMISEKNFVAMSKRLIQRMHHNL